MVSGGEYRRRGAEGRHTDHHRSHDEFRNLCFRFPSGQIHLIGCEHDAFAERAKPNRVQRIRSKSPGESPLCQTLAKDFVLRFA